MNQMYEQGPGYRGRILFACFPADGHFNPLTGLAMHLKNAGYDVRWYTSAHYASRLERLGIPHYGLRHAYDFDSNYFDRDFPGRSKQKSQIAKLRFDLINAFIMRGPEYYRDIRELRKEFPFDLMIADVGFTGIAFVKDLLKIPVIATGVLPLLETSSDLPPTGLGMLPATSPFGRFRQKMLRLIADRVIFGKPNRVMRKVMADHSIDCGNYNLFDLHIRKSDIFLQSGTPGFEYHRSDLGANIQFAGPLLPYAKKNKRKWNNPKAGEYDRIILVTQGTIEKDAGKLLIPAIEAFGNTDKLLVVTTGGSGTEELRSHYSYPNVIIEDFIPFDDIMPQASLYITNGGYGGVLLSIQHELPMVAAGVHEGKNEINARIGYFGLGINLKTERPSSAQLREAAENVMETESFYQNIRRLKTEFSDYNSDSIILESVQKLMKKSSSRMARESLAAEIY